MSDHPHDATLEAIITLPKAKAEEMITAIGKRRAWLAGAIKLSKAITPHVNEHMGRSKVLEAADYEIAELQAELILHKANGKPYRYVVPLTAEEARVIDEEMNSGRRGSTHP